MTVSEQRRANALEILGAWLHLWVPPRDAVVPPVPWRKLAIVLGAVVLVAGVALAILIPRIDASKRDYAARTAAEKRAVAAANHARITRVQTPRHGEGAFLRPAAGASAAEVAAAKQHLMTRVESDIFADARARAAAGELRPVIGPVSCDHTPGTPTGGPIGVFDCFIPTQRDARTQRTAAATIGYPFRAVVDFKRFTYTFCKTEQVPGEMLVLAPKDVTLLPPACRGPKQ